MRSTPHHLLVQRRTHNYQQRRTSLFSAPPPRTQRTMDYHVPPRHTLVHATATHRPPTKTTTEPLLQTTPATANTAGVRGLITLTCSINRGQRFMFPDSVCLGVPPDDLQFTPTDERTGMRTSAATVWQVVHSERRQPAADLSDLPGEQWARLGTIHGTPSSGRSPTNCAPLFLSAEDATVPRASC